VYTPNMFERRSDLFGTTIECATLHFPSITQVHHDITNGNFTLTGLFVDYLGLLVSRLNFTANVALPKDEKYGALAKDGSTWNGMVGMLINNEIDIVTAALTRTLQRNEVIDFATPLGAEMSTILTTRSVINNDHVISEW
jgi:hypothetical protein